MGTALLNCCLRLLIVCSGLLGTPGTHIGKRLHGRSQDFSKGGVTLCQTEGTRVFAT